MEIRELTVPDAFEITPILRADDRGVFLESYRSDLLAEAAGRTFTLRQGNVSVSRYGVGRGIHYAGVPGGQAKYVTVISGSVVDYVVDIRVGSPTFGRYDSVVLDDVDRRAVFIAEGLGHLFVVTSQTAAVSYLTNDFYAPANERGVAPLDPAIGLTLPFEPADLVLSPQDAAAPTLEAALASGDLPSWQDCLASYASARAAS